ncbi:hypothetical protein QLL95_gp0298 [Cotonvirus japonicus]|uniref:Uncharacterized protein n=1 Tax=Cotonvirus japonicus TaxID=2811091 RepID=A0ABM7NRS1_9VIRU|nr:hypothetical protein QLL95_gp0298 [Cotonvirus japonicus]BCS82787.1 hypothetical protein [Cotonvirus japonicus]
MSAPCSTKNLTTSRCPSGILPGLINIVNQTASPYLEAHFIAQLSSALILAPFSTKNLTTSRCPFSEDHPIAHYYKLECQLLVQPKI